MASPDKSGICSRSPRRFPDDRDAAGKKRRRALLLTGAEAESQGRADSVPAACHDRPPAAGGTFYCNNMVPWWYFLFSYGQAAKQVANIRLPVVIISRCCKSAQSPKPVLDFYREGVYTVCNQFSVATGYQILAPLPDMRNE